MTDDIPMETPPTEVETASPAAAPSETPATDTLRLVKIKFRTAGRHYDFGAQNLTLHAEDRVVVETDRGRALGIVVAEPYLVPQSAAPEGLKNVLRHAGVDDINMAVVYAAREVEAARYCRDRIIERRMEMKLVRAEYLFDGSKIIFYFTADGRIDFRELVKDLAHHFHTRIEMRQIGVRDEAKLIGGIGICGRELCCSSYLTEFAPVSVKMAKEQGLALNPNKISGQCGRLLCCLGYEYETYCDLKKNLPKCGRKVTIDGREGEVIDQNILRQTVTVSLPGESQKLHLTVEQIEKGVLPSRPTAATGGPQERNNGASRNAGERSQRDRGGQQSQPQRDNRGKPQQAERGKDKPAQPQAPQAKQQPAPPKQQQQQRPAKPQPPAAQAAAPAAATEPKTNQPQEKAGNEGRKRRHRNRRRGSRNNSGSPAAGE